MMVRDFQRVVGIEARSVAYALKIAKEQPQKSILVNLSGRGDKDIDFVVDAYGLPEK